MKIAVDAMGGDNAPEEIVQGVIRAIEQGFVTAQEVCLVGIADTLEQYRRQNAALAACSVVHASQVVGMADPPTSVLRSKSDSSITIATTLLRDRQADAFISAGNTGAVVAAAWSLLKRLPGVRRPGIAITFSTMSGHATMLDVGANVHCKPLDLFQYAVMADVFCRRVLGLAAPRIGLLNIGEEGEKGTELVKQTRDYFQKSHLNFIGNVEGLDVFTGKCDVIVCEGFVGNVVLKVSEGLGLFLRSLLETEIRSLKPRSDSTSSSVIADVLHSVFRRLDYAEYGGAPILGVNGLVVKMHGRSDRRATANALRIAKQFVLNQVNEHICSALHETGRDGIGDSK